MKVKSQPTALGVLLLACALVAWLGAASVAAPSSGALYYWTQSDWSGGPGNAMWTESNANRYATASGIDGLVASQLGLGFTLPHASSGDLNQDGYPDIVFANWLDQYPPQHHGVESYVYWGGPDGYKNERRLGLPTRGAVGVSVADLDADGYLDLVFSNQRSGLYESPHYDIDSFIYWGGEDGYDPSRVTGLPTLGSMSNAIADLDQDGYLDIVFSNSTDGTTPEVDSYIYWGGPDGYSSANRSGLPTCRGVGVTAADVDQNGYLDLVFSNTTDGAFSDIDSYVYWGGQVGYSVQQRTELPTIGSYDNAAGDLNQDGYIDLVFSNRYRSLYGVCCDFDVPSYIFWGSSSGYDPSNRSELPTIGAVGVSVADLDADGHLDIVFSNGSDRYSYIYWGNVAAAYGPDHRTSVPVAESLANSVADVNRDGHLDLVFSGDWNGFIFWGDGSREYTSKHNTAVTTITSLGNAVAGATLATAGSSMGSVYTRPVSEDVSFEESVTAPRIYAADGYLVSSAYDAGSSSRWLAVEWQVSVPQATGVNLELATSADGGTWSPWITVANVDTSGEGAVSLDSTVPTSRFVRYRVALRSSPDHMLSPRLEAIVISYEHATPTSTPSATWEPLLTPSPTVTLAPPTATRELTPTPINSWQAYLPLSVRSN